MDEHHDLDALASELLARAADSSHGRASRAVIHGDRQRAVLMAFKPGAALGEHDSPPAATLHVLRGRALLKAGEQEWDLGAGELVAIPPVRHSLEVRDEDSVVLLTVAVD